MRRAPLSVKVGEGATCEIFHLTVVDTIVLPSGVTSGVHPTINPVSLPCFRLIHHVAYA
jgi:hypothetical protein